MTLQQSANVICSVWTFLKNKSIFYAYENLIFAVQKYRSDGMMCVIECMHWKQIK